MLTLIKDTVMKVTYKSRHTRLLVTLVNPSNEHVRKLYSMGHDLTVQTYSLEGKLLRTEFKKY